MMSPPEDFVRAAPFMSHGAQLAFLYSHVCDAQGFCHVSDVFARVWIGCVPKNPTPEESRKGARKFAVYKNRVLSSGDFETAVFEDPFGHRHKGYRHTPSDPPKNPVKTLYQRVGQENDS